MANITLTTDFGLADYYVARLKACLIRHYPMARLVDVTHMIEPYDISHGAIVLGNCYYDFPPKTIHVVSVDGTDFREEDYIFFEKDDHFFIGPNNGIFSIMFGETPTAIYKIRLSNTEDLVESVANIAAKMLSGVSFEHFAELIPETDFVQKIKLHPVINADFIRATVVHVDHFGNLFLNLKRDQFERARRGRNFALYFQAGDPILKIDDHYHSVPIGSVVCRFNDVDLLEIAINMGRAIEELELGPEQSIQIEFEN